jgi:hypothetical protein
VPIEPPWLHPEAIKEARAAREWYLVRNAEAAAAFMAELDAASNGSSKSPANGLLTWAARAVIYYTDSRSP